MGAWGFHIFENDAACDWAADFVQAPATRRLLSRKQPRPDILHTLTHADHEEAAAAAEVVAALRGQPDLQLARPDAYTEDLAAALAANPIPVTPQLLTAAQHAIDQLLTAVYDIQMPAESRATLTDPRQRLT